MVLGIDYKHFPVFCQQRNDQNFPLDSYRQENNIWDRTWKNFWKNFFDDDRPYDDARVNKFIRQHGVYMTNSMLCFGGGTKPNKHYPQSIEICRKYIKEQIRIVRPRILLSFGTAGCNNAAEILSKYNRNNTVLTELQKNSPLTRLGSLLKSNPSLQQGIPVNYDSFSFTFWALNQPARNKRYDGDYRVLSNLVKKITEHGCD